MTGRGVAPKDRHRTAGTSPRTLALALAFVCALSVATLVMVSVPYVARFGSGGSEAAGTWDASSVDHQYDDLADAIIEGHVWLDVEPPSWLRAMDDPYDTTAREALAGQTGEGYMWDTAYYQGRYYVYFGIVPCLLFFVPWHLATAGASAPLSAFVLVSTGAFVCGLAALTYLAATRLFPRARLSVTVVAFAGSVAASDLVLAAAVPKLYLLPQVAAMAFSVWGLFFWLRGDRDGRATDLALGSACIGLAVGCRPPVAVCGAFLIVLIAHARGHAPGRERATRLAALLLPLAVVACLLMWYNFARFGSVADFGSSYNLTMSDLTSRGLAPWRVAAGIWYYLLQPPSFQARLPFLSYTNEALISGVDSEYAEPMVGGVLSTLPYLWCLLLLARMRRPRLRRARSVATLLALCAVLVVVVDAEGGGMLARYQLDSSWMLACAATTCVLATSGNPHGRGGGPALVALVALTLAFETLLVWFVWSCDSGSTGFDAFVGDPGLLAAVTSLLPPW